jgi:hypothetical protein
MNDSKISFDQFKGDLTNYRIKAIPKKHVVIQSKIMGNNYLDQNETFILPTTFFASLEKIFFESCHLKFKAFAKLSEFLIQARGTFNNSVMHLDVRSKETN